MFKKKAASKTDRGDPSPSRSSSPRAPVNRSSSSLRAKPSTPSKLKTSASKSNLGPDKSEELLDRFEKLTLRHEELLNKHESLFEQHQALMVKHEGVLNKFESQMKSSPAPSGGSNTSPSRWGDSSSSSHKEQSHSNPKRHSIATPSHPPTNHHSNSHKEHDKSHHGSHHPPHRQSSTGSSNQIKKVVHHESSRSSKSPSRGSVHGQRRGSSAGSNHSTNNGLKVCVRKRPPGKDESDCVECVENQVFLHEDKVKVDLTKYESVTKFNLDGVFSDNDTTVDVYKTGVAHLISNFFAGGTSTCFCFGQTASGKTFTLFGEGGGTHSQHEEAEDMSDYGGIYMLAAADAFKRLEKFKQREDNSSVVLTLSMFEIYGQKVRDLLADCKELAALEDGNGVLQLVGLEAYECANLTDFVETSNQGRSARATNATGANATSSRSHAALLLRLVNTNNSEVIGKFSLIDLAGSERGADNDNTDKQTQMEGRQINTSLLALKEVIRAKELGRHHAPFRQSRLTQVLEESLTGDKCHTTVIGCVSPCVKDTQQTLNTLRYAESLSPNTGKRPAMVAEESVKEELEQDEEEEDEEGGDTIAALPAPGATSSNSPIGRRMSKQPSVMMMNDELDGGDDEEDDLSLL